MKISLNWLQDWVDLSDLSAERVAELLDLHTAEVEGIERFGEAIADVVVGEVLTCAQHPNADKLSVTTVAYGAAEPVEVVCGANNVRAGLKVAFAPVGAVLPGDFKIKKAKLRGQASHGMICSERELELSDEHAGILELDPAAEVGTRLIDHLGMEDSVLELDNKSLTHRPDLWGHYGFARELAAILDRPLKPLELAEVGFESSPAAGADGVTVSIDDEGDCRYYAGLPVDLERTPAPSPRWLQNRLRAVGQRPIDELVDVTNYLMLETGQPTHAFDRDRLQGGHIAVRRARDGEAFTTLDGQAHELAGEDLLITDGSGGVALAGVMGGETSEVHAGTERILLEAAHFHPTRVRRSAQRHGLRTEASARFEKMLDPSGAELAVRRFTALLQRLQPGARVGTARYAGSAAPIETTIDFAPGRAAALLGLPLDAEASQALLGRLGFVCQSHGDSLQVDVPSWRSAKDVTTAIDLVEEVGRLAGYHRIQPEPLQAPVKPAPADPMRALERRLTSRLTGAHGAYETQGYTMIHEDWAARLELSPDDFVLVDNPVQDGVRLIRRDPLPTLLEQLAGNWREVSNGALFELGKGYRPSGDGALPEQNRWLSVLLWQREEAAPHGPGSLFGRARTLVEDLLRSAHVPASAAPAESVPEGLHPARALVWDAGTAFAAALHPALREQLDLGPTRVAVVRIDLERLLAAAGSRGRFEPPSRYPAVKCDVALALPRQLAYEEVVEALRQAGGKILERLELFDVWEGGELAEQGRRSLAFHAVLRARDRTLEDKDEQKFLSRVGATAERLGGTLRS